MKRKTWGKIVIILLGLLALPIIVSGCIGGTGGCSCLGGGQGFDLLEFLKNPVVMIVIALVIVWFMMKKKKE